MVVRTTKLFDVVPLLGDQLLGLLEGPVEEIVGRIELVGAVDRRRRIAARGRDLALGQEAGIDQIGEHEIGAAARRGEIDHAAHNWSAP